MMWVATLSRNQRSCETITAQPAKASSASSSAGTVGPDHSHDPAPGQPEAQIVDQRAIAVALAHVLGLHHRLPQPRSGGNVDLDLVELAFGGGVRGQQRLVGVEPCLGLVAPCA